MFKPYRGKCIGKPGKIEGCGNDGLITTNSRRLCTSCEAGRKPKKAIQPFSDKKKEKMKLSEDYYRIAIAKHIANNKGKCPCEECGVNIEQPEGMNVSHILPGSTYEELYLHELNHNILCKVGDDENDWNKSCHNQWEFGDKEKMKIFEKNKPTIEILKEESRFLRK